MTSIDLTHERFNAALETFVKGCADVRAAYFAKHFYSPDATTFEIERGPKNVRVVRVDGSSRSVHCFVEIASGTVLKAAGWKVPAKHARGNIFDEWNGLKTMGPHGAAYLR
jgi:hypothetical protein